MRWFRFYAEVLDDPKVQKLHPALFKHWVNLLCLASEMDDGGELPSEEAIAFRLRVRVSEARKILDQLVAAGLLDVCGNSAETRTLAAHNWQGRQRSSDNSATRVARHRAAKPENVTLRPPLQKRTVDTDTDTDTDTEKIGSNEPNVASRKKPTYSEGFEEFWRAYPSGYGSKKATYAQWQRLKPDEAMRAEIMQGLAMWKLSERWCKGFVKAAEIWVRDELWLNPAPPAGGPQVVAGANGRASPKLSNYEISMANIRAAFGEPEQVIETTGVVR